MSEYTMAGTWLIAARSPEGRQVQFGDHRYVEVEEGEDPWTNIWRYEDWYGVEYAFTAERFMPIGMVDYEYQEDGDMRIGSLQGFRLEVRTRIKTECQECAAGFVMDFGGPAECLNCQGTGLYWAEAP